MTALFIFFAAHFGFAYIVGHSKLSFPFRAAFVGDGKSTLRQWIVALVECPACLGFWTGAFSGAFAWPIALSTDFGSVGFRVFVSALAVSAVNFVLATYTKLMEH